MRATSVSLKGISLLAAVLLTAAPLQAETVYKTKDKDGNVTYSSQPPGTRDNKPSSGKTEQLDIDPNQNVLPAAPRPPNAWPRDQVTPTTAPEQSYTRTDEEDRNREDRIAEAEEALRRAEAELQEGTAAQAGDFYGRKDGGVRPSPQRMERMNALQEAVERARENLEKARYSRE